MLSFYDIRHVRLHIYEYILRISFANKLFARNCCLFHEPKDACFGIPFCFAGINPGSFVRDFWSYPRLKRDPHGIGALYDPTQSNIGNVKYFNTTFIVFGLPAREKKTVVNRNFIAPVSPARTFLLCLARGVKSNWGGKCKHHKSL